MENIYLKPPEEPTKISNWEKTIFLAGSITGAKNWQEQAKDRLIPYFNVVNPRRDNYDVLDPAIERQQITWEFTCLRLCDIVLFWFSNETLAPITLFELGKILASSRYQPWRKIYIGIDPEYKRKNDIIIQTQLENIDISRKIRFNLDEMLDLIIEENG